MQLTPKQKKIAVLAFGIGAIGLFLWLFMRAKSTVTAAGSPAVTESAPNGTAGNLYQVNFPATLPTTIGGTNIVMGGNSIGNNCGCCDNGSALVSQSTMQSGIGYYDNENDALLSMLANIPPTSQSDLGNAFNY